MTKFFKSFLNDQSGITAVEVALILPIMMTLLLGMADIGNAILVSTKTNSAAQIAADLLTRHMSVTTADIDDAYAAAKMAIDPFTRSKFGLDVASIQYMNAAATPTVLWRQTYNMTANSSATTRAQGLGVQNEGVLVVTTKYTYSPIFSHLIIGDSVFTQVAIAKPRRGNTITKQ